jgi:hypoxanthine phosphoribosyltransferase
MNKIQKYYYTWQEFQTATKHIISKLKNQEKSFSGIYAPPRGGLILGVCLSHALGLPLLVAPQDNCIFADDLIDSGDLVRTLLRYCSNITVVSLLNNPLNSKNTIESYVNCNITDHIFYSNTNGEWIIFPWENI